MFAQQPADLNTFLCKINYIKDGAIVVNYSVALANKIFHFEVTGNNLFNLRIINELLMRVKIERID